MSISRRDSIALASASLAAVSIPRARAAVSDVPTAVVNPLKYQLEKDAELRVLRPAKFIDPDEVYWRENTKKFSDATGVPVRVDYLSWEDIRPQTAVVANTGAGPDIVIGFSSDPQIYVSKILDMTDLADYLGAKYGGWQELAILSAPSGRRRSGSPSRSAAARGRWCIDSRGSRKPDIDSIPDDHEGFLTLCQKLQKIGHPCGFALGHALGDANGFASWLLWSHNAKLVDEQGHIALDSKETLAALKYATELQKTMVSGTLSWNDSGNNKAFASGDIGLTFNGVSIYYFLKNSPDPQPEQDSLGHAASGAAEGPGGTLANVGDADECHGVQAHQVSECREGLSAFHDGSGSVRPLAVKLSGLLVELAEGLFQDGFLEAGSEACAVCRGHGHTLL